MYYNDEAGEQQTAQRYKDLFLRLYESGYRNLQSMAATGASTW